MGRARDGAAQRSPAGNKPLDLDTYFSLSHILVSNSGTGSFRGDIDEQLAKIGRRNVVYWVHQFILVPMLLRTTDCVAGRLRILDATPPKPCSPGVQTEAQSIELAGKSIQEPRRQRRPTSGCATRSAPSLERRHLEGKVRGKITASFAAAGSDRPTLRDGSHQRLDQTSKGKVVDLKMRNSSAKR
jgi:hypothetical protein